MGSVHFLVAAIDRIEKNFHFGWKKIKHQEFFEKFNIFVMQPKDLGELSETIKIEDGQLLRRLIANVVYTEWI